jgi:hypothetical protein
MQTIIQPMLDPAANPVLLLNGPPKVGKNFLPEVLLPNLNLRTTNMAITEDGKMATLHAFGLATRGYTFEDMEKIKDEPTPLLDGMTWRFAISNTVETFKVLYGRDFWAKAMVRKVKWLDRELLRTHGNKRVLICITDPSFPEDVETFERLMPKRTLLARVHRAGRSFNKLPAYQKAYGMGTGPDTRNWLFSRKLPSIDFINNGNEAEAQHDFIQHLRQYVDPRTLAIDRNDRLLSTMLIVRQFRIDQAHDLDPFPEPYQVYWPDIMKHTGPIIGGTENK